MDPSLSISSDPFHPPLQFSPFPQFAAHNPFAPGGINPSIFGAPPAAAFSHVTTQAPSYHSQPPLPPHTSVECPPYADMICAAIAALGESDGSSKQAISRYIERVYSGLPQTHSVMLTNHLRKLKNRGVLYMVKKSYKLASAPPPTGVAEASPTLEVPRSDLHGDANVQPLCDLNASASAPPKRGRGRPPKPKETLAGVQLNAAEPLSDFRSNGQPDSDPFSDQLGLSASGPAEDPLVAKRRPGRPRKSGAGSPAAPAAPSMKRRGRPPGRPRKPKSVSAPATVFPYAANGPRRRGRPRRADSAPGVAPAAVDGAVVAPPPPGKRRGRPPKIGGVISKPMKPTRSTGRPVGRPRKYGMWATTEVSGRQATAAYGELKRKLEFFQEKVKQAVGVLRTQVARENHIAISAINDLEGLVAVDINEPPAQEAQQQELEEPHPRSQAEADAQAEAMQALF